MNFVVVGTNFICDTFLKAALQTNGFNFYGLCSRTQKSADSFLQKYPDQQVKVFHDIESVCNDDAVQAVYIASPNHLHMNYAVQCLKAKKHVLGEKPSASNSKELNDIVVTAKQNECLYMEALMTTLLPNFSLLKNNLPRIGKIRKYIGQYSQFSSRYQQYLDGNPPNWCLPEFSNGALVDLGIYPLSLIIALWGDPKDVLAKGIKLSTGVDGAGDLLLGYDDKQAVIHYSKINNGANITEFQGELGRIEIEFVSLLMNIKVILNDGSEESISAPLDDAFMRFELEHFLELLENQKTESPVNTHKFSLQLMQVMDEARLQMSVVYPADL